jgi:hypothetical protein
MFVESHPPSRWSWPSSHLRPPAAGYGRLPNGKVRPPASDRRCRDSAVVVSLAVGIALALREAGIAERRFAQVRELANTFLFQLYDQATPLAGSTAVRASVLPGVGALFLGAGSDLSRSMSVPISSPEVETGFQKVLKACKAHRVGCAIRRRQRQRRRPPREGGLDHHPIDGARVTQARTQPGDR